MTASWPLRRPEPGWTNGAPAVIAPGAPVTSFTWADLANLANWINGKGAALVPACNPERTVTSGATESFRFRVKPRAIALQRIWIVGLRSTTRAVTAELEAPALTGTTITVPVSDSLDRRTPHVYTQTLASRNATEAEISVSVKATGGDVVVESIACYEQDRPVLNRDSTDFGVDAATLRAGDPIYEPTNASFGGVYDALANADPRRTGIWHWTFGDGEWSRTSAVAQNLLQLAVPVLCRKIGRSAVTGSVKWSVYAKVDAGAGGTVTLATSESGVSDAFTVTGTSFAWQSARTISIDCDDMDSADGRQTAASPAWDGLQISLAGDGTNAIRVKSISVWEG